MNPSILGIADGLYPLVLGVQGSDSTIDIDQIIAEIIAGIPQPVQGNFLQSGGSVIWTSGLSFTVTAAVYYIQGARYTSVQQNITLSTANGTHPRIDVIGLDSAGLVFKVDGVASASPSEPNVDPTTQLQLAFVTIAALATTPTGVSSTTLYTEAAGDPGEWDGTEVGTGFTVGSTSSPITGTKSILCASSVNGDYLQLQKGAAGTVDINNFDYLIFHIKNTSAWGNNRSLLIEWLSSGVLKGVALQLVDGAYGFSRSSLAVQMIAIPTILFGIPIGTTVNQLRFVTNGASINFRLDDIYFRNSGSGQPAQPGGLTQQQADARYIRLANAVNADLVLVTTLPSVTIPTLTLSTRGILPVQEVTASGTVTLTAASSKQYQIIDPDGSNRDVQLPAEASGLSYVIFNVGNNSEVLTIKNDAAGTETTLDNGEVATLISGASVWRVVKGVLE